MTTPTASTTPVSFHVYDGDQLVRRAVFTQDTIRIGRWTTVDLRIEDDSLSRMHAVVEVDGPTGGVVMDLASVTGTYLNGEKVTKARLHSGDEVTVGRFSLVVNFGDAVEDLQSGNAPSPRSAAPVVPGVAVAPATSGAPAEPEPEPEPERVTGLCVVRPGTALVVRSRRTGELRAVRTSGRVMAWPILHTATELDLTPVSIHAAATGEGAALSADGLRVDLTLRLTLRPRCDDAIVRDIVTAFGVPPRPGLVATCLAEVLSPALAAALAEVPHGSLLPGVTLEVPASSACGFDLERVEVLHVGEAVPDPAGGYRGGALELEAVRFVGRFVARPVSTSTPRREAFSGVVPWAEMDTLMRVILGWLILFLSLLVGVMMISANTGAGSWLTEAIFILALCALINWLIHLRTYWSLPLFALSIYQGLTITNPAELSLYTLLPAALWALAVVIFARHSPHRARQP